MQEIQTGAARNSEGSIYRKASGKPVFVLGGNASCDHANEASCEREERCCPEGLRYISFFGQEVKGKVRTKRKKTSQNPHP